MAANIRGSVGDKTAKGKKAENDPFDVQTVQKLLAAASTKLSKPALAPKANDGHFAPDLIDAIKAFQTEVMSSKSPDGRIDVEGKTWKALLKAAGEVDTNPAGWPALPSFKQMSDVTRSTTFGTFTYESDTGSKDPDAIKILTHTAQYKIVTVTVPQIAKVPTRGRRQVQFHQKAANQLVALWEDWEKANLLDRILTWDGSYVPRFMRGTARIVGQSPLSNHSWGSAFDINAEWNQLKHTPAILWEKGCVFELVSIAHNHGFFWGGHFGSRVDGMHFEVAKII